MYWSPQVYFKKVTYVSFYLYSTSLLNMSKLYILVCVCIFIWSQNCSRSNREKANRRWRNHAETLFMCTPAPSPTYGHRFAKWPFQDRPTLYTHKGGWFCIIPLATESFAGGEISRVPPWSTYHCVEKLFNIFFPNPRRRCKGRLNYAQTRILIRDWVCLMQFKHNLLQVSN